MSVAPTSLKSSSTKPASNRAAQGVAADSPENSRWVQSRDHTDHGHTSEEIDTRPRMMLPVGRSGRMATSMVGEATPITVTPLQKCSSKEAFKDSLRAVTPLPTAVVRLEANRSKANFVSGRSTSGLHHCMNDHLPLSSSSTSGAKLHPSTVKQTPSANRSKSCQDANNEPI